MQIYAFVGKTGTGKSYNAQKVAKKYDIEYIIDDAILIKNNRVIAGKSAKTEANSIASVKAAIFLFDDRKNEMIKAIKKENPDKILILGTSDAMVEKIASNLKLPEIYQTIYITDIASPKQIEEARRSRIEEGKHIVPVPTFEIKKQFSGYFLDSLKVFNIFNNSQGKISTESTEKTIIRPTYSYLGNFYISDTVINRIISYTVCRIEGVTRVFKVTTQNYSNGMKLDIDIEVKFGIHLPELSNNIKNAVIFSVDYMTGLNLYSININIKSIKR